MTTFSQMVDEILAECVRPDMAGYVASAINQTIREVHTGQNGTRHKFHDNRVEFDLLVPDGDDLKYLWDVPNIQCLQRVNKVWYGNIKRYIEPQPPGRVRLNDGSFESRFYWYRSGPSIAFFGFGGAGQQILVDAFFYPRSLVYFLPAVRLAAWDEENQVMTYANTVSPEQKESVDEKYTNWLLLRWKDLIKEGARAKVWKRLSDQLRSGLSYSAYMDQRLAMQNQETVDEEVAYSY
jgi:hypothetical protein